MKTKRKPKPTSNKQPLAAAGFDKHDWDIRKRRRKWEVNIKGVGKKTMVGWDVRVFASIRRPYIYIKFSD